MAPLNNLRRRVDQSSKGRNKDMILLSVGFMFGIIISAVSILNTKMLGAVSSANSRRANVLDDPIPFPPEPHIHFRGSFPEEAITTSVVHENLEPVVVLPSAPPTAPFPNNNNNFSLSSLTGIRILVAIAAFDFTQLPHLEDVLDSYHDVCVAGAKVDVVIHSSVAYPVTLIDLLNSRFTCENFSITIVLKPTTLRLHLVDCHRPLFYENIDKYDLFIYTEEDIRVTPRTISTYLEESRRIQHYMSSQTEASFSDFNVGIVRYEYNFPSNVVIDDKTRHAVKNVTRVYWEHSSFKPPAVPNAIDVIPIGGDDMTKRYVQMHNHHQGMFLATQDLLRAWKERPNCNFDEVKNRPGSGSQPSEGTQRVWMSSQQIYGTRHCSIQQVLPMDKFGALTVHHVPNKNYRRVGKYRKRVFSDGTEEFDQSPDLLTAMQLHLVIRKTWPSRPQFPYKGIKMVDEVTQKRTPVLERRLQEYQAYVDRGGVLSESDFTRTEIIEDS